MADKEATLLLKIKTMGEEALGKVADAFKSIGGIATAAFGLVTTAAVAGVRAYQEQEEATNALTQAMVNNGVYSKALQQEYLDQASALQKLTTFSDEQIVQAQASLQMQIGELKITPELTKATLDLATAKKMDLASAAEIVGKSIGTSTNALKRQGIEIDVNGSRTQKLAQVTEELNKKFGGQAEAAAQGYGGIKQLSNIINELFEDLGARIQPTIGVLIQMFKEMALDAGQTGSVISVLTTTINYMAKGVVIAIDVFQGLGNLLGISLAASVEAFSQAIKGNFSASIKAIQDGFDAFEVADKQRIDKYKQRMDALNDAQANADKAAQDRELQNLNASLANKGKAREKATEDQIKKADAMEAARREFEIASIGATEDQKLALQITYLDKQIQNTTDRLEQKRLLEEKYTLMRQARDQELQAQKVEQDQANFQTDLALIGANEEQKLQAQIGYDQREYDQAKTQADKLSALKDLAAKQTALKDLKTKQEQQKLDLMFMQQKADIFTAGSELISAVAGKESKIAFLISKGAAIAQSIVATQVASANALASVPYPANLAAAANMEIVGNLRTATIAATAITGLAEGGIVKARPGGMQAVIGEGGQDEAVIPLDRAGEFGLGGGGGGITIHVHGGMLGDPASATEFARAVDAELYKLRKNNNSISFDSRIV